MNWTNDEIIITMAYYLQSNYTGTKIQKDDIENLSMLCKNLHISLGVSVSPKTRSYGSIKAKLENFKTLDLKYKGLGLPNISSLDQKIWNEYYSTQELLFKTAKNIKSNLESLSTSNSIESLPETDYEDFAIEGKLLSRVHNFRERNTDLIKLKKEKILDLTGKLDCECCTLNFEDTYGKLGKGFIECHHITPVSELDGTTKTYLKDLALICPNCHKMIHKEKPWKSVQGIKYLLAENSPINKKPPTKL